MKYKLTFTNKTENHESSSLVKLGFEIYEKWPVLNQKEVGEVHLQRKTDLDPTSPYLMVLCPSELMGEIVMHGIKTIPGLNINVERNAF